MGAGTAGWGTSPRRMPLFNFGMHFKRAVALTPFVRFRRIVPELAVHAGAGCEKRDPVAVAILWSVVLPPWGERLVATVVVITAAVHSVPLGFNVPRRSARLIAFVSLEKSRLAAVASLAVAIKVDLEGKRSDRHVSDAVYFNWLHYVDFLVRPNPFAVVWLRQLQ